MKPRPYESARDFLDYDKKAPPKPILPYDTYDTKKAGFLTLAFQREFISIPLLALGKATLSSEATSIVLEFGRLLVKIQGSKLDELFEEILLCNVRVIRAGRHPLCTIENILINNDALI